MKISAIIFTILSLAVLLVSAKRGYTYGHNGRPGCTTDEEMQLVSWRHNLDSKLYWVCTARNQPGVLNECGNEHLWQPELHKCVHNNKWVWSEREDPPSLA